MPVFVSAWESAAGYPPAVEGDVVDEDGCKRIVGREGRLLEYTEDEAV